MPNSANAALIDGVPTQWYPVDYGLITWAFDPAVASDTFVLPTAGTLYTVDVKIPSVQTVNNIVYGVTTAGATLTANQCFAGIYQNGVLLGSTAALSTPWASTGNKISPLVSPVTLQEGIATVAFVFNGTTGPTLAASAPVSLSNINVAASGSRFATTNTGVTTALPSALSVKSALAAAPWVGLS